jgi:glycosyltransferase involved in cell wall biosynthesis
LVKLSASVCENFRSFFIEFGELEKLARSSHTEIMHDTRLHISLALMARNEEAHIERCLKSASGLAAEMIVVDTGSTDRTKEIAITCGATVLDFPWVDDFSAARNRALEAANGKWILVLDADEYLPPSSVQAIRALTSGADRADRAYHLVNKSTTDEGRTGISGLIVRLFPNDPHVRYEWPVHEQVDTSLQRANIPVENTQIEIIHTGYSSPGVNAAKQERNLRILERVTKDAGNGHPMAWFLKGGALLDLQRTREALAAYIQCADMTCSGDRIHEAALVRRASCLAAFKRFNEIRAIHPANHEAEWHPELLLLRGQAEIALGDIQTGLVFLHCVFESPSFPRIPAYDPIRVKIRALMSIAEVWEKPAHGRAVAMLKLASQSIQRGREIRLSEVLEAEEK